MAISHRLHSPMDQRPDMGMEQPPKRIVFLSVEGSDTERQYFQYIHKYRSALSIQSVIHVEVLSRWSRDTKSDPQQVYNLIQDLLEIRETGILPTELYEQLAVERNDLSLESVTGFIKGTLDSPEMKRIQNILRFAKIDYDYQKFLADYKGQDGNDIFAIVIDRDKGNHAEEDIKKLYRSCEEKGIRCYISNPCFEFWLLLHICDVEHELSTHYQELIENARISNRHTYVSYELSKRAHHAKSIGEKTFVEYYLHNVDTAIKRARDLGIDANELLNNLGSNLPVLFDVLRESI